MSCTIVQLLLESIRTWMASPQSVKVLGIIELRWMEIDALAAWAALEEFLAIIFFERQRDIEIAECVGSRQMTGDEAALLIALIVARSDAGAAARCLRSFLSDVSARAAAKAAERLRRSLCDFAAPAVEAPVSEAPAIEAPRRGVFPLRRIRH